MPCLWTMKTWEWLVPGTILNVDTQTDKPGHSVLALH